MTHLLARHHSPLNHLAKFARRNMSTRSVQVTQPARPVQAPAFYQTKPPPHHNPNGAGFRLPWPSATLNGLLGFLKARMFDWEDAPLDPNNLPDVSQCDWKPQDSAVGADDILFTWIG